MQMMISVTHPESHIKTDIILKPVVMPDDIKWLQQFTGLDASCLIPFYESIQASSFIQSMMAWDHEQPILQVDICEALFDDVGAGELIGPGDYTLRFQFAPLAPVPVLHQALYNSVEYVFQEKKANRILMQVHKSNKILLDWMKEAQFAQASGLVQKPLYAVYFLTR
jgi:hypothetical protein